MTKIPSKWKEFWAVEFGRGISYFDNEDEAIRSAGIHAEHEPTFTYRFIEHGALIEAEARIAKLKAALEYYKVFSTLPEEIQLKERIGGGLAHQVLAELSKAQGET